MHVLCPVWVPWSSNRQNYWGTLLFEICNMDLWQWQKCPWFALSLCWGGGTVAQNLSTGNTKNYTKSTGSALPYPISVKCRIIAIQQAGTCFTSINRVVLQSIPRGSKELSPFYKWGNSGTGIKARMFQTGCLLLGTYTHIYATCGLIFRRAGQWKFWPEGFAHTQFTGNNAQDGSLVSATCLTP